MELSKNLVEQLNSEKFEKYKSLLKFDEKIEKLSEENENIIDLKVVNSSSESPFPQNYSSQLLYLFDSDET